MGSKKDQDVHVYTDEESAWGQKTSWKQHLKNKTTRRRLLTLAAVSLAGDGWSYEATVIASVIQLPAWINHLGYAGYEFLPDSINTWVGPIYTLGQLFGGLLAAFISDKFGRKIVLSVGSVMVIISTSLLIASPNVGVVLFARVLQGISIGHLLLGYQVYAVELASRRDRGFVSTFSLITGNIFGFIAACILYGITYVQGNWGWRLSLGIGYLPACALFVALFYCPESPRWLYEQGRREEAKNVFGKFHGWANGEYNDPSGTLGHEAEVEFHAMIAAIDDDKAKGNDKWTTFIRTPSSRYRLWVSLSSQFIWAWNGQSVLTYYYTQVFASAGITSTHLAFGINSLLNVCWIFGAFLGGISLDWFGRRFNYLVGITQMGCFLIIQGALAIHYFDPAAAAGVEPSKAAGGIWVTCYLIQWTLWVTFFSSAVYVIPSEIWSSGLRARGFALGNVVSMSVGFATQYSALPTYRKLNGWVWILFGCIMFLASFVVWLTYPEPKGLALEEVEVLFGSQAAGAVESITGKSIRNNMAPLQKIMARRHRKFAPSGVSIGVDPLSDEFDEPKRSGRTEL